MSQNYSEVSTKYVSNVARLSYPIRRSNMSRHSTGLSKWMDICPKISVTYELAAYVTHTYNWKNTRECIFHCQKNTYLFFNTETAPCYSTETEGINSLEKGHWMWNRRECGFQAICRPLLAGRIPRPTAHSASQQFIPVLTECLLTWSLLLLARVQNLRKQCYAIQLNSLPIQSKVVRSM